MTAADLAKLVKVVRRRGEWYDGLCVGHDDHAASLSFCDGDVRVILTCRAGCSDERIAAALGITIADLFFEPARRRDGAARRGPGRLTLDVFAEAKGLPRDFLLEHGVLQGERGLRITYRLPDGTLAPRQRRRTALSAKDGSSWDGPKGAALVPYGLHRLDEAREKGELVLVEGETDALTAWFHHVPCLGIPGADLAKLLEAEHLRAVERVYVLKEPDRGGDTFAGGIAARLATHGWPGEAFALVLPVKDLNDLHRSAGPDFASQLQAAKDCAAPLALDVSAGEVRIVDDSLSWPAPSPVPSELALVPAFDVDRMMPRCFAPWVADIADRTQCPADFVGMATLVATGAVVGRSITIRPKQHDDWAVVPNLWGIAIGRPGIMKTPALQEALRPLGRLVAEAREDHKARMADHDFALAEAQARRELARKDLKKALEKGAATDALREAFKETLPQAPTERRYLVNDATVEKLGELLNENPNGLLLFRDELVGWVRTMDREGHENDRAFFCEAWNGTGSYTYDRIGRGTTHIAAVCLSILGGMTPGPLHAYLREAFAHGASDDGLIQRFQLMVYPDVAMEWRNVDRWPETAAKRRAFDTFKELARLDLELLQAHRPEQNGGGLPFLRFTPEAQAGFDAWRAELERRLRAVDEHPVVISHLAKYRSLMPSLALLFHLVECVDRGVGGPVSLDAEERAVMWCAYLEAHARRVYESVTASRRMAAAALAGKLHAGKLPSLFRARDVLQADAGVAHGARPDPDRDHGGRDAALRRQGQPRRWPGSRERGGHAEQLCAAVDPTGRSLRECRTRREMAMTPVALLEHPLVRAAMAAYQLEVRHVVAAAITSDGAVVIVTAGSRKVRWRPGATVAPLSAGDPGEVKVCEIHGPTGRISPGAPGARAASPRDAASGRARGGETRSGTP